MTSEEIRQRFLDFFHNREHALIPSASLVPQDDPSVLFTTAGMQPLVPYLLGEPHPKGKRLANYQRCLRTNDIDEVGDTTHLTFFEMLGNWSLGDYFKEEAIGWSYEFLTSSTEGLGLDPERMYITVFEGDENAPEDTDSVEIWKSLGIPDKRIYRMPASENWWPEPQEGDTSYGPCGPDSEVHYDVTENGLGDMTKAQFQEADDNQQTIEVWNNVFMEYKKENGQVVGKLDQQNVDTGLGLERLVALMQNKNNVFETDLFVPIIEAIERQEPVETIDLPAQAGAGGQAGRENPELLRARRIIADHTRAAVFIINDGVEPSNTDAGYILRRLLRRAIRYADNLKIAEGGIANRIANAVIDKYKGVYTSLVENTDHIANVIEQEEAKFRKTLEEGIKEFEKRARDDEISGDDAFHLFSTYGMPIEMIEEMAEEREMSVDRKGFDDAYKKHQEASKAGAQERFKGGLAGSGSEMELKYHTATHLLNAALRQVLGEQVGQKGSNITEERLRFDFNHPDKLTDEEIEEIERIVNEQIERGLPVWHEELQLQDAYGKGAIGAFGETYPDVVKVYTIGDENTGVFSKEICGGPHVENTGELDGTFRIKKEESASAGVRRIKAVLE